MATNHLKILGITILVIAGAGLLIGCGSDDDPVDPGNQSGTITSYDDVFTWTCETGISCQDVFDITFEAGTVVNFSAGEVTGNSVLQMALYAPDKVLGGTNLFTGTTDELRCNSVSDCSANTAGQSVSGFVIPAAGIYRLAVTRDWGFSCGGAGGYRLVVTADKGFTSPEQTVEDTASLATGWDCPSEVGPVHDQVYAWDCALSVDCQDVFDIEFAANSTVSFTANDVTGGSVLQMALYAPGVALGGTNLFTGTTEELLCNPDANCVNNTGGQSVASFSLADAGVYRLAITRNWGRSCGGTGTYHLVINSSRPMISINQTTDDTASAATGEACPN